MAYSDLVPCGMHGLHDVAYRVRVINRPGVVNRAVVQWKRVTASM